MSVDGAALVAFTQQLVRIPSVHDPARGLDEEPAAELVAERMRSFGWEPQFDVVEPGRPNVTAVVEGGGGPGPTLMFEGHTDVVTEGDGWTVDPFGGDIVGGRLYGRGAADMKGGLAAMLYATDALQRRGPFPGRVVLAALVDEEGMMLGAKDLVARGRTAGVDAVICCEPEGGEICHVAKGALRLRVDFNGKMAHGAMPFQGRNPNRAAGQGLVALAELERAVQARFGEHPHLGLVWITPTVLRAGEPVQMNVMPAGASMWVDVRTVPAVDHGELVAELTDVVAASADDLGVTTAVTVIDDRPAVATAEDAALVRAVWDAHAAVTGAAPRLGGVPGATDGTIITSRTGMPSVVYGPGGKWIAHQADEFVEVEDLLTHANVYVEAADRFLRHDAPGVVTPGRRNDLTDVGGFAVGHHSRRGRGWLTGTTVVLPPPGTVGGVDVRGGGPGTRETDLLDPVNMVNHVDAICLTGGSAYGLDAAGGVMAWLEARGRGFQIGTEPHQVVPIVPTAVVFDLGAGGDFSKRPDAEFGHRAAAAARARPVRQGSVGAGTGAHAAALKGGIGSASVVLDSGVTVAALVVLNSGGSPVDPATGELWGARYGLGDEFAVLRRPSRADVGGFRALPWPPSASNTTLAVVATDADLTKPECGRVAGAGHDGMARAISPIHMYTDGDVVFTLATGDRPVPPAPSDGFIRPAVARFTQLAPIIAAAADVVARAVVHATLAATSAGSMSSYADQLPSARRGSSESKSR